MRAGLFRSQATAGYRNLLRCAGAAGRVHNFRRMTLRRVTPAGEKILRFDPHRKTEKPRSDNSTNDETAPTGLLRHATKEGRQHTISPPTEIRRRHASPGQFRSQAKNEPAISTIGPRNESTCRRHWVSTHSPGTNVLRFHAGRRGPSWRRPTAATRATAKARRVETPSPPPRRGPPQRQGPSWRRPTVESPPWRRRPPQRRDPSVDQVTGGDGVHRGGDAHRGDPAGV